MAKMQKGSCKRVKKSGSCLCRNKNGKYRFAKKSRCGRK